uniref:chitin synthase n=1 Tax=Pythium aphanidermatum TaxID=65070 RepID=H6D5B8_PYTAP|nr:chitin synthase [Pythium aphanidermatum]
MSQYVPPSTCQSIDYDSMAMPPASIRSCGSQAYVSSFIPTSGPFPPRSVQDLISSMKSYASATDFVRSYNDVPSVEEALATLERAAVALKMRRYRDALKLYLEGGYAMANVAERQSNPKICNLLTSKGFETLNWCGRLCDWIEGRIVEKNPRPGVHKVAILVNAWNEDWVGPYLDEEESMRMWYTPVYVQPSPVEFTNAGYRLRCVEMHRRPRLMICITIYNEGPDQLKSTLRKLANNIKYLQDMDPEDDYSLSKAYSGENVWQNVVICIVADGREQINPKMLEYLDSVGLYDEDLLTINSAGIGAQCHMFERTIQLTMNGKHLLPMQTIFVLKENKASKLDSHNWYFNAFAEQIQPEYTILMDVGTMLTKSALYHMLYAFETNPQIGGACGQLTVEDPFRNLSNWVISAQHFEYKIANILDKSLESCFGFISVLPGAFSGYRYKAIRGAPLDAYFQTLNVDLDVLGPFAGNMYLAEDRILCFELLARKNCSWTMHYVKDAVARTDVPHELVSLIAQRRRWLNGSFFATLFSIWNFGRVYSQSSHSPSRKFFLSLFYLYHVASTAFSFFLPANVYLALFFIVFQGFQQNRLVFIDTSDFSQYVLDMSVYMYNVVYLFGLLMLVIIGLGNNPKHMKLTYYFVSSVFAVMMILSSLVAMGVFFSTPTTGHSIIVAILTVGVYFIGPALHGEVHHIMLTFTHYTALIPSFVNIFTIYSFCNLQDLSWGTKGLEEEPTLSPGEDNEKGDFKDVLAKRKALEERRREFTLRQDNKKKQFEAFRTNVLLTWAFSNLIFALAIIYFSSANTYLPALYLVVAVINSIRLLGCVSHLIYTWTEDFRSLVLNTDKGGDDKDGCRGPDDSYCRLDDHYAQLIEDQRVFVSERNMTGAPQSEPLSFYSLRSQI